MASLPKYICYSLFFLISPTLAAAPATFQICTQANPWYPFTYEEQSESKGLHVDIVKQACQQVGLQCEFVPLPWKRCLLSVELGDIDAVVSASYTPERAKYMSYPAGAGKDQKSAWRITQAEYVVVTHVDNNYEFIGDISTLPQPVTAPLGYSIVKELNKSGLDVKEYSSDIAMYKALLHQKKGSVISITPLPALLDNEKMFKHQLKALPQPITSKSYFMPISKKTTLSNDMKIALWKKVVEIREDKQQFDHLLQQYK